MSLDMKDSAKIKGLMESLNNPNSEFNDDFDLWYINRCAHPQLLPETPSCNHQQILPQWLADWFPLSSTNGPTTPPSHIDSPTPIDESNQGMKRITQIPTCT